MQFRQNKAYCDPGNSQTCQQCRSDPDADEEEGKEKAEGEKDDDLGQQGAEEYAPESNNKWDEDNTESTEVNFGILLFPEPFVDHEKEAWSTIGSKEQNPGS